MTETTAVTTKEETGLTFLEEFAQEAEKRIDINVLGKSLKDEGELDLAKALYEFYKLVHGKSANVKGDSGEWSPADITINQGKGESAQEGRLGDLINKKTSNVMPRPIEIYPLFGHVDHKDWENREDKQRPSNTIDGEIYHDVAKGRYFHVSEIPVKPTRKYTEGVKSPYTYAMSVYCVDRKFTNMYKVEFKSYSLKMAYDKLVDKTNKFTPTSESRWIKLGTNERGEGNRKSYAFNVATGDDQFTAAELKMVKFFQQTAKDYYDTLIRLRDEDRARIEAQTKDLEDSFEKAADDKSTADFKSF